MSDPTTESTEMDEYGSERDIEKGIASDEEVEEEVEEENEDSDDEERYGGAELSWKDIRVFSGDGKKVLLHKAVGRVRGRLLAIMGPSGAGKTSLLNLLAGRLQSQAGEGDRMIDGHKYKKNDLKRLTGYVMQDDVLFPYLTVKETLVYGALLRLSAKMPMKEKRRRADELLVKLGLEKCKNTQVGDSIKKGISGGERKRLAIAIELLAKPKILFLDEPTSGLDSVTALAVMKIMKDLARSEKTTIICTIHQPSTKLFKLFDDLMVLKAGQIVYHGPVSKVLDYYSNAGFPCPLHTNPGDHVLDVITPNSFTPEAIQEAQDNAEQLMTFYHPADDLEKPKKGKVPIVTPKKAPWIMQFLFLTQRSFRNNLRARVQIATQILQTIIFAFLIGGVYYQIGNDQLSIAKRGSVLFFVVINQGIFAALILINSFPSERVVILRERAAGMYSVSAYYLAKTVADTVIQVIFPVITSIIVYFMVGFQYDAGKFFIFLCFVELGYFVATSAALAISTICRTVTLSVTILPFVLEICRLFGGFFLPPLLLPNYFAWIDALSFVKYTYMGMAQNEWSGLTLYCTPAQLNAAGKCPITDGHQQIVALGLDKVPIYACALVLIGMILLLRIIAYLALRWDMVWSKLTWANIKTCCGLRPKLYKKYRRRTGHAENEPM
eukprot:TRINITY_DN1528_c0_g1_i2.p1 TRINITY_DN1528_c0_g1~~TRINITY_DN1528_c0_g1_i2.p1  ORF type:complete len:666 (-),score=138.17 TRINITY_DN1528_c0_g1_i2:22-2019(-)